MTENKIWKLVAKTWNPFTGCTKISPACKNCYAEKFAMKLNKWGTAGYENKFNFTVHKERVEKAIPLHRKRPTFYFINSMSDTFHEDADEESLDKILEIVNKAHWHSFYFLTKRSKRMKEYFEDKIIPDNLWLGVTVENKEHGFPRIKDLQDINCKNKHICCEPLLEDLGDIDLNQIKIVIAGWESGWKEARKTDPTWVKSLLNQCKKQDVHFYWKQWWSYGEDWVYRGKNQNWYLIDGKVAQSLPDNFMP